MKNLFYALLMLIPCVMKAQTFDNKSVNTLQHSTINDHQPKVIYDDNNDNYYHLANGAWSSGAILSCIDMNGNVLWKKNITVPSVNWIVYSSLCFNDDKTAIALVGTVGFTTDNLLVVTEVDLAGAILNNRIYDTDFYDAEGIAIRTYGDDYVVGGNCKTCAPSSSCNRVFLARIESGTLALGQQGLFDDVNNTSYESFMDLDIIGDQAVVVARRNGQTSLVMIHFDLGSFAFIQNYGAGQNAKWYLYNRVFETAIHIHIDETEADYPVYMGSGTMDQSAEVRSYHARFKMGSFNPVWSKEYTDTDPNNYIYSNGRLLIHDDQLISNYRPALGAPDNGILNIDRNSGNWTNSIRYNGWGGGYLNLAITPNGSHTVMTGYEGAPGNNTALRYFDGDAFGVNNMGCGNYAQNMQENDLDFTEKLLEYELQGFLADMQVTATSTTVNGTYTDCSNSPIGSYKKDQTTGIADLSLEKGVYPNPTTDIVNIKVEEGVNEINITDATGRVVKSWLQPTGTVQFDLSSETPGLYIISINGTEGRKYFKVNRL